MQKTLAKFMHRKIVFVKVIEISESVHWSRRCYMQLVFCFSFLGRDWFQLHQALYICDRESRVGWPGVIQGGRGQLEGQQVNHAGPR